MERQIMISREETLKQVDLGIKVAQDNSWTEAHKLLEGVKGFIIDLQQYMVETDNENLSGKTVEKISE